DYRRIKRATASAQRGRGGYHLVMGERTERDRASARDSISIQVQGGERSSSAGWKNGAPRSGRDCHGERIFPAGNTEYFGQCANTNVAPRDLQCGGLSRADEFIRQICAAR